MVGMYERITYLPSLMVINVFLIPLVTVRGEGALFCWLFARFLSLGCRMPWAWRECTTRTTAKNFSSNTVRGKNFRTAPYYYKINLFPQWQCIVFVIVFSIQELNARCRMGLCGNFTLSESTRFHVFFLLFLFCSMSCWLFSCIS